MNSKTTCRIMGWLYLLLGGAGVTVGHIGTYLLFNGFESYLSLGFGFVSVLAARRRRRTAALTALLCGMWYLVWGTSGLFLHHPLFGSVEPLDSVIHELTALWSIGAAIQDVLAWRKQISSAI